MFKELEFGIITVIGLVLVGATFWLLKALDSIESTNEINSKARKALVKELARDNVIKDILLCEN